MEPMEAKPLVLIAFAGLASVGSGQLMPTYGSVYGYTNYWSDSWYGFPASVIFSDSHSAFIASFLSSSGTAQIDIFSDLAPTDESPETNVEINVSFDVASTQTVYYTAGSWGAFWSFVIEDTGGGYWFSTDGWGDTGGSFSLDAGSYQMRYYTNNSFWSGGSYQHTSLQLNAVPEPASLAFLGIGLLAVGRRRRS